MGDKKQRKTETWHQNVHLLSQTRSLPEIQTTLQVLHKKKAHRELLAPYEETTLLCKTSED